MQNEERARKKLNNNPVLFGAILCPLPDFLSFYLSSIIDNDDDDDDDLETINHSKW